MGLLTVVTASFVGFSSGEPRMGTSSFTATTGSTVTTLLVAGGAVTSFSVWLSVLGKSCSLKSIGVAGSEELVGSAGILQVRDGSARGPAEQKTLTLDSSETY